MELRYSLLLRIAAAACAVSHSPGESVSSWHFSPGSESPLSLPPQALAATSTVPWTRSPAHSASAPDLPATEHCSPALRPLRCRLHLLPSLSRCVLARSLHKRRPPA